MRCLVTGAAGFIGSHLSAALIDDGCAVVGLDDLSTGSIENLAIAPQVELVVENLCNEEAVTAAAQGCKVIFHLGAIRSVPRSMAEPGHEPQVSINEGLRRSGAWMRKSLDAENRATATP